MTSFKLVNIPRIKNNKGLRKFTRKVPTDHLLKFERVLKAQNACGHFTNKNFFS